MKELKTYILKCSKCGKEVERSYKRKKATCFDCKKRYYLKGKNKTQ